MNLEYCAKSHKCNKNLKLKKRLSSKTVKTDKTSIDKPKNLPYHCCTDCKSEKL